MDSIDLICTGLCPPTRDYIGKEIESWPYWVRENGNTEEFSDTCKYGIEGWEPVTKYYYHNWPSAIKIGGYNNNGTLRDLGTVSSGLTDEDKAEMTESPSKWIGSVVSLVCMSINKRDRTLRHPVFKQKREDKDTKDCLIEEVFR